MRGLADSLDPDSAYLIARVGQVRSSPARRCPTGDVGIELTRRSYLRVIAARDGSPAAKAGLQTGDYVRAIDGKPARDLSVFEGMRLLRGAARLTVMLTVIRGNAAEPQQIELVRETAARRFVTAKMIPPDVGYIRIAGFGPGVAAKLKTQAEEVARSGATSLIVDLRRTAEGPFESGSTPARLFVQAARWRSRPGATKRTGRETVTAASGDGGLKLPVTLLVTTGTSGRAEAVRGRARRQQARGPHRRAHARPRRHPEAGPPCRGPWPLAHLRALPHARRRGDPGQGPVAGRRGRRA